MRPVTNMQLLAALVSMSILVTVAAIIGPLDSQRQNGPYLLVALLILMGSFVLVERSKLTRRLLGIKADRPVSDAAGSLILGAALSAWLVIVVGLMAACLFIEARNVVLGPIMLGLAIAGLWLGRYLMTSAGTKPLVAFSLSLTAAMIVIGVVEYAAFYLRVRRF